MIVLEFILLVGMLITLWFFTKTVFSLRKIERQFSIISKSSSLAANNHLRGLELMKKQHEMINTEETKKLLRNGEQFYRDFVVRLRILLVFAIPFCIILFLLK